MKVIRQLAILMYLSGRVTFAAEVDTLRDQTPKTLLESPSESRHLKPNDCRVLRLPRLPTRPHIVKLQGIACPALRSHYIYCFTKSDLRNPSCDIEGSFWLPVPGW